MMPDQIALIVEDDRLLGDIFARALGEIAYQVNIIRDGQSALDWLQWGVPDLIILDLHQPFASGETILEYVEQDGRFANTRVMIVTADARMGGRAKLTLIKPVDVFHFQRLAQRLQKDEVDGRLNEWH